MGLFNFLFGDSSSSSRNSFAEIPMDGYEVSFDNFVGSDSAALEEVKRLALAVRTRLANPGSSYIREWPSNYRGVFNDYFDMLLRKSRNMKYIKVGNGFYFGEVNSYNQPEGFGIICDPPHKKDGYKFQQFEIGTWSALRCTHNGVLIRICDNDLRDIYIKQSYDKDQYYEMIGNRSTWSDFHKGYFNPYYR